MAGELKKKKKRVEEEDLRKAEEDGAHGQGLVVSSPTATEAIEDDSTYIDVIFGNDLIFGLIGDYLGVSDMKAMRSTCKLLLGKVNGHRSFVSNTRIIITDESSEGNFLKSNQGQGGFEKKTARIVIASLSRFNYKRVPSNSLRHLEIHRTHDVTATKLTLSTRSELSSRTAFYKFCISSDFPHLESLTFDISLLIYKIPINALMKVVATVRNLNFVGQINKKMTTGERGHAGLNIDMIQSLAWRIRSLSVANVASRAEHIRSFPLTFTQCITNILTSNSDSMEKISLGNIGNSVLLAPEGIRGIAFPRLKDLTLAIHENEYCTSAWLAEFLNRQPPLELLQLNLVGRSSTFNPAVLEAMRRNCGPRMHTLEIDRDYGYNESFLVFNSWEFIQDMSGLKKLRIKGGGSRGDSDALVSIFSHLHPSIQSLNIGADRGSFYIAPNVSLLFPQRRIVRALTGFPHLTHLRILKCYNEVFDDEALQSICTSLTGLVSLEFFADLISDFGFTGKYGELEGMMESDVSLRNLKGLRNLNVRFSGCEVNVTKEGLVEAIQFPELKSLVLLCREIPDEFLFRIASNNPSLESFARSIDVRYVPRGYVCPNPFSGGSFAGNPRLKSIETQYAKRWRQERYICRRSSTHTR